MKMSTLNCILEEKGGREGKGEGKVSYTSLYLWREGWRKGVREGEYFNSCLESFHHTCRRGSIIY